MPVNCRYTTNKYTKKTIEDKRAVEKTYVLMATNTAEDVKHESEAVGAVPDEVVLKKGPWTAAEDAVLKEYVTKHGEGNWNSVQKDTGLARCGKSCRLRWVNHLQPNLKKGAFSPDEEKLILQLHVQFGNKWARMAALLPGRTDNEIKNYWNTRVKRRQRQGLPLYSDEPDRSTTSPKPMAAPALAPPPNATRLNFLHHHRYYPLSSPTLPPHSPLLSPLEPKPAISDPMIPLCSPSSSSTSSPHSFIFGRPAPLLGNPLGFKRFRTSSGHPLRVAANTFVTSTMPQSVEYTGIGSMDQANSLSHIYQAPLFEYDRVAVLNQFANSPAKLELPSNQFSKPNILQPAESKFNMQMNNVNNGFLGDPLFEAQTAMKKPSYLYPDEGNDLDGHRGFHDLPLNSSIWSSNAELKQKEEAQDLSKSMTNDLSSMLAVMPSTPSVSDWPTGNAAEVSNNNVQSSGVVIPYNNFELDNKPIASLFPKTTTTNHNDNYGCFSWDELTGLGFH